MGIELGAPVNALLTMAWFRAAGNGVTDDSVAFNAAAASGKSVMLVPGTTYAVGSRISIAADNTCFYSDGSGSIVMLTSTGKFTNTVSANRYNSNSCLFLVNGFNNVRFEGITITLGGTPTDDNACIAVGIRNSVGSSIVNCDISGFRKGTGMISVDSSHDIDIVRCKLHDGICKGATLGQLTGVSIDDNLLSGVYSTRINVTNNKIYNLTVDATFLAANGYQTDGVTISKKGTTSVIVALNSIRNVGEGVDCFGSLCKISTNDIRECYNFGAKLIHGASFCTVQGNTFDYIGLAAVGVFGSNTAAEDVDNNKISGNSASNINPIVDVNSPWHGLISDGVGPWDASGSSAGYRSIDGTTSFPTNNTFENNKVFNSPNAAYGIVALAVGRNNKWLDYEIVGTFVTGKISNLSAGDYFRNANRSFVHAVRATNPQAVPTATFTTIVFDSELSDTNGEYDPTTGIYTPKTPQRVTIASPLRASSATAGNLWTELILCSATGQSKQLAMQVPANNEFGIEISGVLNLNIGDTVRVQLKHDKGSDQNVSGAANSATTNLQIMEL